MRRFRFRCLPLAAALAFLCAPLAFADDEPESSDISAKIKAQMEKILALMKENQDALLELSAGRKADAKKVDVEVPPPAAPDSKQGPSGAEESKQKADGKRASQELEKLIRTAGPESKRIPSEIEQLLEMIPT